MDEAEARQETDYGGKSAATDEESLNDTVDEDWDEDAQWPMDHIMHEAETDAEDEGGNFYRQVKYLVKWTGYSIYKASWEPSDNFNDFQDVLFIWGEEKMRRIRGDVEAFDTERFENDKAAIQQKRARRHERRNKKRRKQGLEEVVYHDYEDDADDEGEESYAPDDRKTRDVQIPDDDEDAVLLSKRQPTTTANSARETPDTDTMSLSPKKRRLGHVVENPRRKIRKGRAVPVRRAVDSSDSSSPERSKTHFKAPAEVAKSVSRATTDLPRANEAKTPRAAAPSKPPTTVAQSQYMPWSTPSTHKAATVKTNPQTMARPSEPKAPMARMVRRGPGPATKVTANRSTSATLHVFSNFSTVPNSGPFRRERPGALHKNLSHRNAAQKRDAREAAPQLETLNLYDPTTGNSVQRGAQQSPVVSRMSSDLFHPPGPGDDIVKPVSEAEPQQAPSAVRLAEPTNECTKIQTSSSQRRSSVDDQLTCWFWLMKGNCRFGRECGLAHFETGRWASRNKSNQLITCAYWHQGKCARPDDICDFAHRRTRYIASTTGLICDTNVSHPTLRVRQHTCWYWYHQTCNKSDENCDFAHEMRPLTMDPKVKRLVPTPNYVEKPPTGGQDVDPPSMAKPALSSTRPRSMSRSPSPDQAHIANVPEPSIPFIFANGAQQPKTQAGGNVPSDAFKVTFRVPTASKTIPFKVEALLVGIDHRTRSKFRLDVGSSPNLDVNQCWVLETVRDLFKLWDEASFAEGDVVAAEESSQALTTLAENLRNSSVSALVFTPKFTLVVFPPGTAAWDAFGGRRSAKAQLQFRLLAPIEVIQQSNTTEPFMIPRPAIPKAQLDLREIFNWFSGTLDKQVFLIFPLTELPRQETLVHTLRGLGAKVYRSQDQGAWSHFVTSVSSGAIIIDSSIYQIYKIPRIRHLLHNKFNFFVYGPLPPVFGKVQAPLGLPFDPQSVTDAPRTLHRLLPEGQAVFILDSCFEKYPGATLDVVKSLVKRHESRRTTRIVGRPNLVDWLLELSQKEHEAEKDNLVGQSGEQYKKYLQLHSHLSKLLYSNPLYMNREVVGRKPKPSAVHSPLFFLLGEEWPGYAEALGKGQASADELAVSWFGGWSVMQAMELRKFVVVTDAEEKTVGVWEKKWMHMSFLTPRKYMDRDISK